MIKLNFTPNIIQTLEYERFHNPHPQVRKRMEALYLRSQRLLNREICRLCRIPEKTLIRWIKLYQEFGISGLKNLNYKGQPSALNAHIPILKAYFKAHPPATVAEAQAKIEEITEIHRSLSQIRALMKRMGLKLRKVGHVPGKACSPEKMEEQDYFQSEKLEPRLQEAKEGKQTLFL